MYLYSIIEAQFEAIHIVFLLFNYFADCVLQSGLEALLGLHAKRFLKSQPVYLYFEYYSTFIARKLLF